MSDFYHPLPRIRIYKACSLDSRIERAVRLYCEQHGERWNLQIRGPMGIGNFGMHDGKTDIIAGASLHLDDVVALHDELGRIIKEFA